MPSLTWEAHVLKSMVILFMLFVVSQPAQQPASGPPAIPADAATLVNPVKSTPTSQAFAKKMYGYDCAMCHGVSGDGKGEIGVAMKPAPKDFTDPASLKDMSDGTLFYTIKSGKGEMQGEGERLKTDDVWNMVILVRSFAKKG
jgi:mono/diheme cytochrome c family protein